MSKVTSYLELGASEFIRVIFDRLSVGRTDPVGSSW